MRLAAGLGIALLLPSLVTAAHAKRSVPYGTQDTPQEVLRAAGAAYEAGKYAEALAGYERVLQSAVLTPALAYNTGNTHYRLGRKGLAVLWYERARRLSPRDEDIRFNLSLARSGLDDDEGAFGETLDRVLSPSELPWVLTVLIWLLFGTAGWALWRNLPWARVRGAVLASLVLLALFGCWWMARTRDLGSPWAVVTVPVAEVRSGPGNQFTVGFTVPEGRRALMLNHRPGWIEIGVPGQGLKGWVTEESVAGI